MRRLYVMCNGGHMFTTPRCPYDGWTAPAFGPLLEAAEALAREGQELSLDALRARGLGDDALRYAVVLEFGNGERAFRSAKLDVD